MGINSIREIDYVILLCEDMEGSRTFYRDVMRFSLEEDQKDWVRFRVGSGFLTLRPRGQWLGWHDGAAVAGSASVQLAFRVTPQEVDACHVELVQKGVEILDPPQDQAFAHRTLFFRDPEGNVLEIYAEM
jgi:catechol 2,3-dioxygenase-like lactoylglutathione lyase family enzyme